MPIRYLVSRHAAAITWIKQRTQVDRVIENLDCSLINKGDTVIGTLPVHLAAAVCERGGHYLHLELTIPSEQRGQELSLEEMSAYTPTLTYFHIMPKKDDGL